MASGFDWLLYLDVADHLMGRSSEEFLRSATSRAYYGVFCSISRVLKNPLDHPPNPLPGQEGGRNCIWGTPPDPPRGASPLCTPHFSAAC
jgi:hypothetical protein